MKHKIISSNSSKTYFVRLMGNCKGVFWYKWVPLQSVDSLRTIVQVTQTSHMASWRQMIGSSWAPAVRQTGLSALSGRSPLWVIQNAPVVQYYTPVSGALNVTHFATKPLHLELIRNHLIDSGWSPNVATHIATGVQTGFELAAFGPLERFNTIQQNRLARQEPADFRTVLRWMMTGDSPWRCLYRGTTGLGFRNGGWNGIYHHLAVKQRDMRQNPDRYQSSWGYRYARWLSNQTDFKANLAMSLTATGTASAWFLWADTAMRQHHVSQQRPPSTFRTVQNSVKQFGFWPTFFRGGPAKYLFLTGGATIAVMVNVLNRSGR